MRRYAERRREKVEPPVIDGRVPRHNLDAESAVLSAILLDTEALDKVVGFLKAEHFYSEANEHIYKAACDLSAEGEPIDTVTVARALRDRGRIAQCGGASYLAQLCDATPSVANVAAHARGIVEDWRLRRTAATCQRVSAEAYGDVESVQVFVEQATAALEEIRASGFVETRLCDLGDSIREAFTTVQAAYDNGGVMLGRPTGYDRLDAKTAGLHDGDLTIVAARPGMGKTSFVLNLAVNVASPMTITPTGSEPYQLPGDAVAVFSLEMPREQLAIRMVCSEARVDLGKLRQGFANAEDWRRMTEAASYLSGLPIVLDDTPSLSMVDLRAKCRATQRKYETEHLAEGQVRKKLRLVVVDYLQLMKGRDGANSREQEISEISRGMKQLAKELGVPVIALSQLNRAVETRTTKDKRPQISDLRESGAIEQDADTIILIYRDEYYFPETTTQKGITELNVAKQRNGPTGKVLLRFAGYCARFDNLAPQDYPQEADE